VRHGFWRSGEPYIWLTAGALATALLMVGGLLAIIVVNAAGFFWPSEVVRLTLKDGTVLTGPVTDRERIPGAGDAWRLKLHVANRDLYAADFVWADERAVVRRERPADVAVIERTEWGLLIGRIVALEENGTILASGPGAWAEVGRRLPAAGALRTEIRTLEKREIGAINYEQERIRLRLRGLESRGVTAGGDVERARQRAATLEVQYAALQARLAALRARQTAAVVVAVDGGQTKALPLTQVLDVSFPNAMGPIGKIGRYAAGVWKFGTDNPRESNTEGGVFPAIFGTVMMVMLMSLIVTPLGVLAAFYLREYARQGAFVSAVRIAVNNLAGVPSIVFGVFGVGFFIYGIGGAIDRLFYAEALPTPTYGTGGILWASLTLALLTIPVVIVATEEGLAAIPGGTREASLALGATKLETTLKVVLPAVMPSILTGLILAMARAAGEVAPLMITGVVKLAPALPVDGFWPFVHLDRKFMHLGFHIYDVGFQSPNVDAARPMVFATTLLLLAIVVVLNLCAIATRNRLRRKYATAAV
jgi:phosphate transport system permease protein